MRFTVRQAVVLALTLCVSGNSLAGPWRQPTPNPASTTLPPNGVTNVSAGTPKYIVNATPNPLVFIPQGNCPWLLPALSAEGFAKVDATNPRGYSARTVGPSISSNSPGAFTRQVYYPWADNVPAYSLNGLNSAARVDTTGFRRRSHLADLRCWGG